MNNIEHRYQALFECADLIFILQADGKIKDANSAALKYLEYGRDAISELPLSGWLGLNSADFQLEDLLSGPIGLKNLLLELKTRSGNKHFCKLKSICKTDSDEILLTISPPDDFQSDRNKEQTHQTTYGEIIDSLEDGYFEVDLAGCFTLVNNEMVEILGYSRKELIGMSNRDYMRPDKARNVFKMFNQVYHSGISEKGIQFEVVRKNGETRIVEASLSVIKSDRKKITGFRGTVRDVTERIRMEEKLKLSEQRYRTILEDINELYLETDLQGNFLFFNDALCETFEYSRDELNCVNYKKFIKNEDKARVKEIFFAVFKTGKPATTEHRFYTRNGKEIQVESKIFLQVDKDGTPIGFRGVARDITSRKSAEQELIRYKSHLEEMVQKRTAELSEAKRLAEQANLAKSEFLANISHELRTPLHGVLSFSKFGIEKIESIDKEKTLHFFKRINDAGNRLLFLVNDLLDLSRLESGKTDYAFEKHNLFTIVEYVKSGFKAKIESKMMDIVVAEPRFETTVICDSHRITQVIQNLLSNAVNYSDTDTTITVFFEQTDLVVNDDQQGSQTIPGILVGVKDQGIGIPEEERELIFDKFKQSSLTDTGAGGRGLGLSICRHIIEAHKGSIWAESNPEGGSIFKFTLPISFFSLSDSNQKASIVY